MELEAKTKKRLISPAGAGLVAICFFLPWFRGCDEEISGAQLAYYEGEYELWLVLVFSLAIVMGFYVYDKRNDLLKFKPIAFACALSTSLLMVIKLVEKKFYDIMEMDILYGSVGAMLGVVLSLAGLSFWEGADKTVPVTEVVMPPDSWTCGCGHRNYPSTNVCQNCLEVHED